MKTCKNKKAAIGLIFLAILTCLSGCHKAPKVPPPVVPSNKFDLKGLFLGMSKEEAKAAEGGLFCHPRSNLTPKERCYVDNACFFNEMSIAGKATKSTLLTLKEEQVTALDVWFPTEYFVDIAAAFVSQYGKPKRTEKKTVQNRLGASFEKTTLTWEIKDASVTMSNIDGKVDEGSIHVEAAQISAQMAECILNAKNAAKNDL
jgi:hypothetical protein